MTWHFGGFLLDSGTRQLTHGGRARHLSPKAFDLLCLLLERRPAVVDKAEIRERLWPGTHVVDASLSNLVTEIRSALDDDSANPTFVRTAHGVGYAFAAPATTEPGSSRSAPAALPGRCWLTWRRRDLALEAADTIIGRDPACAVWIDAPGVSRRHARIVWSGHGANARPTIEDLGSTNGTIVRGRRITDATPLDDGDSIRLGEATLTFHVWRDAGKVTKKVGRKATSKFER